MKPMTSAETFAIQFAAWNTYYAALLAGDPNRDELRATWRQAWANHLDVRASERAARRMQGAEA